MIADGDNTLVAKMNSTEADSSEKELKKILRNSLVLLRKTSMTISGKNRSKLCDISADIRRFFTVVSNVRFQSHR